MYTLIHSYTEALLNPVGRFATLNGIFALRDHTGEPIVSRSTNTINYAVELRGREYILRCFITDDIAVRQNARRLSEHLSGDRTNGFITEMRYLDNEMLVFNIFDQFEYYDVILQERPQGSPFNSFLIEMSRSRNKAKLRSLLKGTASMAETLHEEGFSHGNIKPSNIVVGNESNPMLINFEYARCNAESKADNYALGMLSMTIYVAMCRPDIYEALYDKFGNVFLALRQFLPEIIDRNADNNAVKQLAVIMNKSKGLADNRDEINRLIREIAEDRKVCIRSNMFNMILSEPEEYRSEVSFSGRMQENKRRVRKDGGKWVYVDHEGKQVISASFDFAEDFSEGMAVVGNDDSYGMIDRDGNRILPMVFEEVRWSSRHGVAIAQFDGISIIYNRLGERLTREDYDWMGDIEDGLIATGKENKYGYLRKDGSVAIPFKFDNAYDFRRGRAIVDINGEEYYIDTAGEIIAKVGAEAMAEV